MTTDMTLEQRNKNSPLKRKKKNIIHKIFLLDKADLCMRKSIRKDMNNIKTKLAIISGWLVN